MSRQIDTEALAKRFSGRFSRKAKKRRDPKEGWRSIWVTEESWRYFRLRALMSRNSIAQQATELIDVWVNAEKAKKRARYAKQRRKLGLSW